MAPRAHWKGFLKLSLVSCPITLYPAIATKERISFRQVNRQTGNRLRQQLVDAVTGEPVQAHDKTRGYEVGENQFLLVRDDELEAAERDARRRPFSAAPTSRAAQESVHSEPAKVPVPARPRVPTLPKGTRQQEETVAIRTEWARPEPISTEEGSTEEGNSIPAPTPIENNRTIEIDRFIPCAQVDARYLDTPYYVVPRDEVGQEAFAVIRDAMRRKEVVGMGRVVLARRERPIILEPLGDGIRGITLRYSHEIRHEAEYLAAIPRLKLPEQMLRVAEHIVETKTEDFDPTFLEDRYRTVLISKLKEKHAAVPNKALTIEPAAENVISLMDVLKRSLAAEGPAARPAMANTRARRMRPKGSATKRANSEA